MFKANYLKRISRVPADSVLLIFAECLVSSFTNQFSYQLSVGKNIPEYEASIAGVEGVGGV